MEVKKKNFLENLKTKFGNKKPGRKALAKQGRNLANRRSISVPDLRSVPGEAFSTEKTLEPDASDAIFFGFSPGVRDTDSVVRGSVTDGPLFTDRLSDSVTETTIRVPTDHTSPGLNRLSAPVETLTLYEEIDDKIKSSSENKMDLTQETLYAQVTKRTKGRPTVSFDPVPAPRHSNMQVLSPIPDLEESESLSDGKESTSEETPMTTKSLSGTLAAVLVRAHSLGEQGRPCIEKRDTSTEKGTPPIRHAALADRMPLTLNMLGPPLETADGTSMESACGTPSEEQVSMFWTTDSEEPDREPCSPCLKREIFMEETLVEETLLEEAQEETAEVSINISVILLEVYTL